MPPATGQKRIIMDEVIVLLERCKKEIEQDEEPGLIDLQQMIVDLCREYKHYNINVGMVVQLQAVLENVYGL